jgi:hypothetical protein
VHTTDRDIDRELIEQSIRLMRDVTAVRDELRRDPDGVVARAFPRADGLNPRALVGARVGVDADEAAAFDRADFAAQRRLLEAGAGALDRIQREGADVVLRPDERLGLQAVVRFAARPAVLFRQGKFLDPPPPWDVLEEFRESIDTTARSVGRIQVPGLPTMPYGGSGFLVADDVIMTNCHVAQLFATLERPAGWVFRSDSEVSVDFADDPDDDPDADPAPEMIVDGLIGMHERLDLALLRVTPNGAAPPPSLTLMSQEPEESVERRLYLVGYPAPDRRNDPVVLRQIFGDVYYVKRLQPGVFLTPSPGPVIRVAPFSTATRDGDVFAHDASTLGGNSGSCVVDLRTDLVAGLHYSGLYAKYNQAIALWKLVDDPLLKRAGVNFD